MKYSHLLFWIEDLFEEWSQQFDTKTINNYVSDLKAMYSWIDNQTTFLVLNGLPFLGYL